jgi:hypothetical protein
MNNIIALSTISLCLGLTNAFQLQGAWSLTQIASYPTLY